MKIYVELGKRMKEKRLKAGLSELDLAIKIGVSKKRMRNIELGASKVTLSLLCDISEALNVDVKEFLYGL